VKFSGEKLEPRPDLKLKDKKWLKGNVFQLATMSLNGVVQTSQAAETKSFR
jgi:hypothetical protein